MKPIRCQLIRALCALIAPCSFLQWLNRWERMPIRIDSRDDGWVVSFGDMRPCERPTLRGAVCAALRQCEDDPGWVWSRDFLRTWKPAPVAPENEGAK